MDYNTIPNDDTVVRPFHEIIAVMATVGASSGPASNVVNALDISAGGTVTIAAGSITAIAGYRTLGITISEASGNSIVGTVTVSGKNQFGKNCKEVISFSGTDIAAVTKFAYTGKPTITYSLTGTAASDTLSIGTVGFGVPIFTTAPLSANWIDVSDGTSAADTGTWDAEYSTFKPSSTVAVGDSLILDGKQDIDTELAPGGEVSFSATTSF